MTLYRAPLREHRFVLNELLEIERYRNLPRFSEVTPDLIEAILGEGARMAEDKIHPLNQTGDEEGCHFEAGRVTTPAGFKEAYSAYVEGGWVGLAGDPDYGGQGLPKVVATSVSEMVRSANLAFSTYAGLAEGAAQALSLHGSDEQKRLFLGKLTRGEWGGTMELTEPHCGTDLGLIRTKAEPQPRWDLRDQRDQDLHHRRRARSHRQHRPSRAGAYRRRASGHQGSQPLYRAQIHGQSRWQPGRTEPALVRRARAQDGDQGLGDLRDEL